MCGYACQVLNKEVVGGCNLTDLPEALAVSVFALKLAVLLGVAVGTEMVPKCALTPSDPWIHAGKFLQYLPSHAREVLRSA